MRILLIGFPNSIHTLNWINCIDKNQHDIHFFPSRPFEPIHRDFPLISYHSDYCQINWDCIGTTNVIHKTITPFIGKLKSKNRVLRKVFRNLYKIFNINNSHQAFLTRLIKKEKPDVVHLLETQNSGYLYLKLPKFATRHKVLLSIWGIDLHYFGILPQHNNKIKALLSQVDYLLVEGQRDLSIAKQFGYDNKYQIIQSTGGLDLKLIKGIVDPSIKPSQRKAICIKGTQNLVRRGLFAIASLRHLASELKEWKIYIYSCSEEVRDECIKIIDEHKLDIVLLNEISHLDMLTMFAKCRINLIINRSDGISNSLLESISVGCFPIISDTSCADDIITHGTNGYIVKYDDTNDISKHLYKALHEEKLIDNASLINYDLIRKQFDRDVLKQEVNLIYK